MIINILAFVSLEPRRFHCSLRNFEGVLWGKRKCPVELIGVIDGFDLCGKHTEDLELGLVTVVGLFAVVTALEHFPDVGIKSVKDLREDM